MTYRRVFAERPPELTLITVSSQISDRNQDIVIRNNLKLDPPQVRSLWRRQSAPNGGFGPSPAGNSDLHGTSRRSHRTDRGDRDLHD